MDTVIVAFESDSLCRKFRDLLEGSGSAACLICHSGSQRGKQIDGLAGDLHLFVRGHATQRSHVVQTVRDLDQNHPHIVRKR